MAYSVPTCPWCAMPSVASTEHHREWETVRMTCGSEIYPPRATSPSVQSEACKRIASLAAELQAVRAELARVRRNHLRRMGEATRERVVHMQNRLISRGIMDSYPHKRVIAEMNRFAEACRAALANNAKDAT